VARRTSIGAPIMTTPGVCRLRRFESDPSRLGRDA
jgi:hypothetical protein